MLSKALYKTAYAFLALMVAVIIFNNIFVGAATGYVTKKLFVMPYMELMAIAVLLVIVLVHFGKNPGFTIADNPLILFLLCVALYFIQVYFAKRTMFITVSWDAGRVLQNAMYAARGEYGLMDMDYFSYFPNNRGIYLLDYIVCKRLYALGRLTIPEALSSIIKIEAFVSALTAFFVQRVIYKISLNSIAAYFGWFIYALLLGLSGWVIVPYTDMTVVAFPVLIYYLYLKMDDTMADLFRWFFIFLLTVLGFSMKPTVAIMLIAIILCGAVTWLPIMLTDLFGDNRIKVLSRLFIVMLIGVVTVCATNAVFSQAVEDTGLLMDEEKNTGALHMLMMGLNASNAGAMTWDDIAFSQKFVTREERKAAQLDRIDMIMDSYRPSTFMSHLSRKALVVFNDGTFAWGEEGGFYDERLMISPIGEFLREFTYKGGSHYMGFSSIFQLIWYMMLVMMLFTVLLKKDERHLIPVVSVIGIILFNLLFEARARYLIVYAPMIIVVAVLCLDAMIQKQMKKDSSGKSPLNDKIS